MLYIALNNFFLKEKFQYFGFCGRNASCLEYIEKFANPSCANVSNELLLAIALFSNACNYC